MHPRILVASGACCWMVSLVALAAAVDGAVGRDAEKGDPARWYQPADTPQLRYETAMKEALAALAEALKECRSPATGAERKASAEVRRICEAEARSQYKLDTERARNARERANPG